MAGLRRSGRSARQALIDTRTRAALATGPDRSRMTPAARAAIVCRMELRDDRVPACLFDLHRRMLLPHLRGFLEIAGAGFEPATFGL